MPKIIRITVRLFAKATGRETRTTRIVQINVAESNSVGHMIVTWWWWLPEIERSEIIVAVEFST